MNNSETNNSSDFSWEVFKHIDSIREGRTNFFLVAEAMMIAAYTALPSTESFLRITVGILGVIYTVSWYLINKRQSNRLDFIAKKELPQHDFLYEVVKSGKGISGKYIMNYVMPISTGIFWIVLILRT